MRQISISLVGRDYKRIVLWLLCLLMVGAATLAQVAGTYEISWYSIDGGGGTSMGGPYVLTGTIAQTDANWSSGGKYELLGGFLPGGPLPENYARTNADQ